MLCRKTAICECSSLRWKLPTCESQPPPIHTTHYHRGLWKVLDTHSGQTVVPCYYTATFWPHILPKSLIKERNPSLSCRSWTPPQLFLEILTWNRKVRGAGRYDTKGMVRSRLSLLGLHKTLRSLQEVRYHLPY